MTLHCLPRAAILAALCAVAISAHGANTPCSGKKGGVSHCAGPTFICNDGSVSASKRICSVAGKDMRALPLKREEDTAGAGCTCRSHQYCTGPRGGQYCFTDGGNKSYRRR